MIIYDAGTLTNKTKVVLESDHAKELLYWKQRVTDLESDSYKFPTIAEFSNLQDDYERLAKEIEKWRVAEKEISDAYLRIRKLVGAWDTQEGGVDRFDVTELAIRKLVAFWEWSRLADKMTFESYEWKK